jgi:hypothetical protein
MSKHLPWQYCAWHAVRFELDQHIYIWFKYMQPPNSNHICIFTGIWCILTIWSLFQSPRHWTALCCESLLPKMIMSFNMSISKSSWVSISGSIAGTIEHRRCACRCFWHGCNWIHTPKRSACSPHSFWSLLLPNLYLGYHLYVIFLIAGSWNDVFKVSVALYIIGTLVWNIFSTGEKILD